MKLITKEFNQKTGIQNYLDLIDPESDMTNSTKILVKYSGMMFPFKNILHSKRVGQQRYLWSR